MRADSQVNADEASGARPGKFRVLQDGFAERLALRVGALTGSELTVKSGGWTMQSYAEFLATVAEHTCCHILAARAAGGEPNLVEPVEYVWIEIDRGLAFVMIDALLGGDHGAYIPDRALTGVEHGLLRHVIDEAGTCLAEAWSGPGSVSFETVGPGAAAGPGPLGHVDQPVTVLTLHLAMSGQSGTLRLCLPRSLFSPGGAEPRRSGGPIEISVVTAEVALSSSDLAGLSAGDILTTDTPADGEVIIRVAGIPKFRGLLGTCNGRRAVTITRRITDPPEQAAGA